MPSPCLGGSRLALIAGLLLASPAAADPLTADAAVQTALRKSPDVVNARANVLDARSGLYSAYSGVMPRVSATGSRSGSFTDHETDFGTRFIPGVGTVSNPSFDNESYSTVPSLTGSWNVLDLSSLSGLSSARQGLKAARLRQTATRNDVALDVRRQFYTVVQAIHLARVNAQALRLALDDERRVRALFEVGSVSKSDVLKAQVRTAQSQLDSLTAVHQITIQRIVLASAMGIPEAELGDIDTTLTFSPTEYNEETLRAQAERSRPDLLAAEAELGAARANRTSARFGRLPYVTVSGTGEFDTRSSSKTTLHLSPQGDASGGSRSKTDRSWLGQVALNWNFFDGFATDSRNAGAEARLIRARDNRDALRRNLTAEVHQALLAYREAVETLDVAQRAVDSAAENMKLTQEKYNVGSATILDLIDAQVQLQRAQNQAVSARANVRVAEAGIRRVSGQGE